MTARTKRVPYFSQSESREITSDVLARGSAVALVAQSVDVDALAVPINCKRVRFAGERVQLVFDFDGQR